MFETAKRSLMWMGVCVLAGSLWAGCITDDSSEDDCEFGEAGCICLTEEGNIPCNPADEAAQALGCACTQVDTSNGSGSSNGGTDGPACNDSNDCETGFACYSPSNTPPGSCVQLCDDTSCPTGLTCTDLGGASVCLGGGSSSNGNTSNGNTSNGNTSNGNTSNGNTSNGNTSNGGTSNGNTSNPCDGVTCDPGETCNRNTGLCEGGGGGSDCEEACDYLDSCANAACTQPLLDRQACIDACDAQQASQILSLSCDDIMAGLCQQNPQIEQVCECPGGGGGGLTCGGIFECFQDCGENDQACLQGCFGQGSAEAQGQYNDIATCVQANCPEADQACVEDNCGPELDACFAGGGGGGAAFCLDLCDPGAADTCGSGTFCLDLGDGTGACAAGSADAPAFPEGAQDCAADGMCGDGQECFSAG